MCNGLKSVGTKCDRAYGSYVVMRSRAVGSIKYISLGFQSRYKSLYPRPSARSHIPALDFNPMQPKH